MPNLSDLTMQPQAEHTEWCWACVTASVIEYFDAQKLTPGEVVARTLANPACAQADPPSICDTRWPIVWALDSHVGAETGALSFADLQTQIDMLLRPVVAMVVHQATIEGGTVEIDHFCLIKACSVAAALEQVTVLDPGRPAPCEYQIPYAQFCNGGFNGAVWQQTILTQ